MKIILIFTVLISLSLTVILKAASHLKVELDQVYEMPVASNLPDTYRSLLPETYEVPDQLPATIQDPLLLAAWVYLYNQTEAITIHNAVTVSGRSLAEYVLERKVPVTWSSDEICRGNSCSFRPICRDAECIAKTRTNKVNTLYLSPRYNEATREMLPNLAG